VTDRAGSLLFIEDDEGFRQVVARHLRSLAYEVTEAAAAEEAVRALRGGLRPDLVLLDLNLPGDTGWDLLRGAPFREAGSPPVVIASAVTVSPKRLAEFGVAGYLPKPFPLEVLVSTVERVLAASSEGGIDSDE
jgi:CheY-like chemotaxis protein